MAPESLRGEKAAFAIDMWALGVMFYEMVFGFSPFLAHEVVLPTPVEFPDPVAICLCLCGCVRVCCMYQCVSGCGLHSCSLTLSRSPPLSTRAASLSLV